MQHYGQVNSPRAHWATGSLKQDSHKSSLKLAVLVAFMGTGSTYAISDYDHWLYSFEKRTGAEVRLSGVGHKLSREGEASKFDFRSDAQKIENVRESLKISMGELAKIFGVSRQAVYKWLDEKNSPDKENSKKIAHLSFVADGFRKAGIERPKAIVGMKVFDKRSVLDTIKDGVYDDRQVELLISEYNKMKSAYDGSAISKARSRTGDSWSSEISIPGAIERA